jgi:hypothetical protein
MSQTVLLRMLGLCMNDKLDGIWKEVVRSNYLGTCLEGLRKPTKISVRIDGVLVGIGT